MTFGVQNNNIFGNPLFETGPIVIFLWNNDSDWSVQNVTQNVSKLFGYDAQEFKSGKIKYADLVHKEDLARVAAEVEDASDSKEDTFLHKPYRIMTKNGEIKWLIDNTSIITDDNGKITHYLGYLVDGTSQVHTEIEAKEIKERYELALAGSNDGIWDWNIVTNEVYYSPRWKEMIGYRADEIENNLDAWTSRVHPDDLEMAEAAVAEHLRGESDFYETQHRMLCKDGSYKWVLDRGKAIFDEHSQPIRMAGSNSDIDRSKRLEHELSDALDKFKRIFNISQVGLSLIDNGGKIVEANDKTLEIFGLKRDETIHQTYAAKVVKGIKPDGTPMSPNDYAGVRALKERKSIQNVEFGIQNKEGGTTWIVANATPLDDGESGVIVSYTDITYKKELEDALKKVNENLNTLVESEVQKRMDSEAKLEKIFESISVGVVLLDEDGRYIDFNEAYANIYGYTKEEMLGANFMLVIDDAEREEVLARHHVFMDGDTKEERFYFQGRKKDGQAIDIFGTSSKATMNDKHYKITTIMDVTEQKKQEKILIEQSRLAEMGEMIGVIAHQWRQPLNAIAIIIQDIKVAFDYGEIDKELIAKAVKNSMEILNFMSKTIDDFRGFFRKDKEILPFEICDTVSEVIRLIKPQLTANDIFIEIEPECDEAEIYGYPNEFKQAMLNIITNAKDAILEKRTTSKDEIRGNISIKISKDIQEITISVKDNGTGIKSEHINKIFEPYFSTKSVSGTGIGLYMTQTIIEKNMGGKITAKNWENGAIIEIKLSTSMLVTQS
jgi:PAS domain S-box-containing protein